MKNKNLTEISMKDIKYIMGDNFSFFNMAINNVYCGDCPAPHETTIVDYRAYLNYLQDIVLKGHCKKCRKKVGRYIEMGEDPEAGKRARKLVKSQGG